MIHALFPYQMAMMDYGRTGGGVSYVNPPFGSYTDVDGKKKGPTAWARKCMTERDKGKTVVMVYPIDKWVLMMIEAGAEIRNLKDIRWHATEDGSQGPGTGRHVAMFILKPVTNKTINMPFTTIIEHDKPSQNFLLLKPEKQLREGDKIIFQTEKQEDTVTLTHASDPNTKGLMKGYQLIAWNDED